MTNKKTLTLAGGGVSPRLHITRHVMSLLESVDCVAFYQDPGLEDVLDQYFNGLRVPLDDLYPHGGIDEESYDAVVNRITALFATYENVLFIQQGNPRFGVTMADMLGEACSNASIKFEVLPGISSFDAMMIDVNRDPLEYGSVVIDANRLLLFSHKPQIEFDYYIYHICSVGTRKTNIDNPMEDNLFALLHDILIASYPSDHACQLIESEGVGIESGRVVQSTIVDLQTALGSVTFGTSLFIPAVGRPNVNESILARMMADAE